MVKIFWKFCGAYNKVHQKADIYTTAELNALKKMGHNESVCFLPIRLLQSKLVASQYKVRAIVSLLYTSVLNPSQDEGQKGPRTSFSPVTSINEGISPQNFL